MGVVAIFTFLQPKIMQLISATFLNCLKSSEVSKFRFVSPVVTHFN